MTNHGHDEAPKKTPFPFSVAGATVAFIPSCLAAYSLLENQRIKPSFQRGIFRGQPALYLAPVALGFTAAAGFLTYPIDHRFYVVHSYWTRRAFVPPQPHD